MASPHSGTTRDFLDAYHQYETANSFNLGAFLSNLFNRYGIEAAIVLGSVFAGVYLIMNGLTILGLGMPFVVFLFVYLYTSYVNSRGSRGWPPLPEDCPNGFYKDPTNQDPNQTTCVPLAGYSGDMRFQYATGNFSQGCDLARSAGLDWDRCGF